MKVTLYTINDCKFSQAEKDYLKTNNIAFEEKNVEQNRDFLTEMLGISENFAGTPVTQIEKDDGTKNVLKGFTQEEFDKEFGLATGAVAPMASAPTDNTAAPTAAPSSPAIGGAPDVAPPTPPTPPKEMNTPAPTPEPAPIDVKPVSLSDSGTSPAPAVVNTPPAAPEPVVAAPAPDAQTKPISLSENLSEPKAVDTSPTPPTVPPAQSSSPQPAPDATSAPAPSASSGQAPGADPLNSVLENLQSQVKTAVVPEKPAANPPAATPAPKV